MLAWKFFANPIERQSIWFASLHHESNERCINVKETPHESAIFWRSKKKSAISFTTNVRGMRCHFKTLKIVMIFVRRAGKRLPDTIAPRLKRYHPSNITLACFKNSYDSGNICNSIDTFYSTKTLYHLRVLDGGSCICILLFIWASLKGSSVVLERCARQQKVDLSLRNFVDNIQFHCFLFCFLDLCSSEWRGVG